MLVVIIDKLANTFLQGFDRCEACECAERPTGGGDVLREIGFGARRLKQRGPSRCCVTQSGPRFHAGCIQTPFVQHASGVIIEPRVFVFTG